MELKTFTLPVTIGRETRTCTFKVFASHGESASCYSPGGGYQVCAGGKVWRNSLDAYLQKDGSWRVATTVNLQGGNRRPLRGSLICWGDQIPAVVLAHK